MRKQENIIIGQRKLHQIRCRARSSLQLQFHSASQVHIQRSQSVYTQQYSAIGDKLLSSGLLSGHVVYYCFCGPEKKRHNSVMVDISIQFLNLIVVQERRVSSGPLFPGWVGKLESVTRGDNLIISASFTKALYS